MQLHEPHDHDEAISAAFDGELPRKHDMSDPRTAALEKQWQTLRSLLQAMPVQTVDLVTSVRSELESVPSTRVRSRSVSRRSWLPLAPAVVALLLVALLPMLREWNSGVSSEGVAAVQDVIAGHDPQSWNVVVVDVPSDSSIQDAVRCFLGAAEHRGARVTPVQNDVDESAEYSAGFLLTTDGDSSAILETLDDGGRQMQWNPSGVDGRSHEEIKEMFLASMNVPTKSDRVFGAMYVVNEHAGGATLETLPRHGGDTTVAIAQAPVAESKVHPLARSMKAGDGKSGPVPLMVVFRRQNSVPPVTPVPEQGQLAPPVARQPVA